MPVIRCCRSDGIDVIAIENLTKVFDLLNVGVVFANPVHLRSIGITNRDHFDTFDSPQ